MKQIKIKLNVVKKIRKKVIISNEEINRSAGENDGRNTYVSIERKRKWKANSRSDLIPQREYFTIRNAKILEEIDINDILVMI